MKKILSKLVNILIMIVFALAGAAGGILLSASIFSRFFSIFEAVLGSVGIILCFYIAIIVHEGGHLLFGLLTGYKFSSFRVGSLMWVKQNGKIRLRRFSLAGTGGQCLMIPPEKKDGKTPVVIYNLGGVFANLALCVVFVLAYFLSLKTVLLALVFLFGGIVSFILALTNGLPINVGGIANDGMNALHLSKNPDAAEAFCKQLLMNAAQTEGRRISEMPDEWFCLPDGADMQNVHCASLAVFATNRHLDRGDTLTAEQEINKLLHSGYNIIGLHKNLLICDLIYCKLVNNIDADIKNLLTPELKKLMQSMKSYPSIIRTKYVIALISEHNEEEAQEIRTSFEKLTRKFPYRQDIEAEQQLMDIALQKAKK